mgnify:CR=1 FL=1
MAAFTTLGLLAAGAAIGGGAAAAAKRRGPGAMGTAARSAAAAVPPVPPEPLPPEPPDPKRERANAAAQARDLALRPRRRGAAASAYRIRTQAGSPLAAPRQAGRTPLGGLLVGGSYGTDL